MKIEWTQEKKDEVCKRLEKWLVEHGASAGEVIAQDDDCQIDAPNLIGELVDEVIHPITEDSDYE